MSAMKTGEVSDGLPVDGFGRLLHRLASAFAVAGGGLLVLIATLVVTSIIGRAFFDRPVPGDFEIVGIGTAVAVFLFIPYCYLQGGNVAVDIFVAHMPAPVRLLTDTIVALLFGGVALLFAWRMTLGLRDVFHYADVSMIVGLPLWWAYPFAIASFGLLSVSSFYTAFRMLCDGR
jgi:TRAP-type C4-dicarboxylate transport system permease small subunit